MHELEDTPHGLECRRCGLQVRPDRAETARSAKCPVWEPSPGDGCDQLRDWYRALVRMVNADRICVRRLSVWGQGDPLPRAGGGPGEGTPAFEARDARPVFAFLRGHQAHIVVRARGLQRCARCGKAPLDARSTTWGLEACTGLRDPPPQEGREAFESGPLAIALRQAGERAQRAVEAWI